MNNEFEIAKNYGATAYLIYSFVKKTPNATISDVQNETGLSRKTTSSVLNILCDVKLIDKKIEELYTSRFNRYTTIQ